MKPAEAAALTFTMVDNYRPLQSSPPRQMRMVTTTTPMEHWLLVHEWYMERREKVQVCGVPSGVIIL